MATKLDPELTKYLHTTESGDRQREVPVIVTLREGADVVELERHGLKVAGKYASISAVYGSIAASAMSQLEGLDFVTRIEYDGRASAYRSSTTHSG